jgi:hypothetical protein
MRVIPACVAESKSWKYIPPSDCNEHIEGEGYLASVRHCPKLPPIEIDTIE